MEQLETVQPESVENKSVEKDAAAEVKEEAPAKAYAEAIGADNPAPSAVEESVNPAPETEIKKSAEEQPSVKVTLQAVQPEAAQPKVPSERVCEVCGHVNKSSSWICEMCSNYLID